MPVDKYLSQYPLHLKEQVESLIADQRFVEFLLKRYPFAHQIKSDQHLRDYVHDLKNSCMKKSPPLSKVVYDNKIHVLKNALGLHSYVSRVQGNKLKSKNEIRISSVFKNTPEAFLRMITVHELAHLKEKEHNQAFYRLCRHMLPEYHQLEFDMRLYLVQLELNGCMY